jgi:hypothetical protein
MSISYWLRPGWTYANPRIRLTQRPAGLEPPPARISCTNRMTAVQFRLFSLGIAAVVLTASGCNPTLMQNLFQAAPRAISGEVPPFKLDTGASMVIYEGNDSPNEADAADARTALANLIQTRYGRGGVTPARFRLRVHVSYWWWVFVLCVDTQIIGCPTGYTSARATLELQVGDQLFVGHGQGSGYGGLYYNKLTGIDSALGDAIGDAVRNLFST